jgi:hypothetical protein
MQILDGRPILLCLNRDAFDPTYRALSGEEFIALPLMKQGRDVALPEMSVHFILMFLLSNLVSASARNSGLSSLSTRSYIVLGEHMGQGYCCPGVETNGSSSNHSK